MSDIYPTYAPGIYVCVGGLECICVLKGPSSNGFYQFHLSLAEGELLPLFFTAYVDRILLVDVLNFAKLKDCPEMS